jgi:hypothetical protein
MSNADFTGIPDAPCTPVELSKLLGCNAETVRIYIAAGYLDAVDVSRPGSSRPSWRITPEAVVKFFERRSARKSVQKTDRRRPRSWKKELDELLAE